MTTSPITPAPTGSCPCCCGGLPAGRPIPETSFISIPGCWSAPPICAPEHGGGSLTALPIVETEAQNIAAYIPTNLISITDGQIYLTPGLFQKGIFPAVDVGKSVSRVGGKAQLPAYRAVAGDLRLTYSQFQELEAFSRFGTRLDERTRKTLDHGYRVREMLKQNQFDPMPVAQQIAVLLAVTQGLFDDIPLDRMAAAEKAVRRMLCEDIPDLCQRIEAGEHLER